MSGNNPSFRDAVALRRPHTLYARRGRSRPRQWYAISASATQHPCPGEPHAKLHILKEAHLIGPVNGEPIQIPFLTHYFWEPIDLWSRIYNSLSWRFTTWVFVPDPWYTLGLLRLWELIDQNSLKLLFAVFDFDNFVMHFRTPRGSFRICGLSNYYHCDWSELMRAWSRYTGAPIMPKGDLAEDAVAKVQVTAMIMTKMIHMFTKTYDSGWANSLSGLSYQLWLSHFYGASDEEKICIHDDPLAAWLERQAYASADTRVCRYGGPHPNLYVCDVRSCYPYMALSYQQPVHLAYTGDSTPSTMRDVMDSGLLAIAAVKVKSRHYPCPHREGGRVDYPLGEYWTVLTTLELMAVQTRDEIVEVAAVAYYNPGRPLARIMKHWLSERKNAKEKGDETWEHVAKIAANSLIGKIGRRANVWMPGVRTFAPSRYAYWYECVHGCQKATLCRCIGGRTEQALPGIEHPEGSPAISAHITACARLGIHDHVRTAGEDNVYYRDADSLHVNSVGWSRLGLDRGVPREEPGLLWTAAGPVTCTYHGVRDYVVGDRQVIAGVPGESVCIEPGTYFYRSGPGILALLTQSERNSVMVRDRVLRFRRETLKGKVLPDGRVPREIIREERPPQAWMDWLSL